LAASGIRLTEIRRARRWTRTVYADAREAPDAGNESAEGPDSENVTHTHSYLVARKLLHNKNMERRS